MTHFKGRVAVVTGAASGIGRELALLLADRGSDLALCDIDENGLKEVSDAVLARQRRCFSQVVDVSNRDAVERFAADATAYFNGQIHFVFNNAGVALRATVEDMDYDDFEWVMNINFWGVVYGTKAFLPVLKTMEHAHLVNVSSVFGLIGVPTQSAYNAAKFAVRGFTESLHEELLAEKSPVRVSCVHPGGIKTAIARNGRIRPMTIFNEHTDPTHEFDTRLARTSPTRAARVILDGVVADNPRILIGLDAHGIDWSQRLFPALYQRVLATAFRRGLDKQ